MAESKAKLKNLFQPGTGVEPPYLAGRLEEQTFFNDQVEKLVERQKISRDMIVYGPRGNGKTVMLRYLQKETLSAQGNQLDIAWATPRKMGTLEGLVGIIAGSDQKMLKKIKNLEISANVGIASVSVGLDVTRATAVTEDLLREKSKKKPFILIMDEAHTLTPEMGGILLDASQNIRGEECPFFLVLAGTPNLETALSQASATFWSRNEKFGLGRLSSEEARQALTIPLEPCQVTCAEDAISEVIDHTHRYPYFIQIWGEAIANRLHDTGVRKVAMDTIREVKEKAAIKCTKMYRDRYNELDEMGLVPLAADIGRMFTETDRKNIPREEFKKLVGQSLQEQGLSVTNQTILKHISKLSHIGYIWQIDVPGEVKGEDPLLCYEPGIPSLMRYVRRQTAVPG